MICININFIYVRIYYKSNKSFRYSLFFISIFLGNFFDNVFDDIFCLGLRYC